MELGLMLSSEEHPPLDLVRHAQAAEAGGFGTVFISDHFHPWLDEQGQIPFVWSVIGGIATTTRLRVMTGVTCPTMRIHPAVIAHAAATSAAMLPGRFRLGVGSGENLNEHILGDPWPPVSVRLEMLEEAIEVIRLLWTGKMVTRAGRHYTVHNARLYTLPETPPPVLVSGFGPKSVDLAARIADGYVTTKPDRAMIDRYTAAGGRGPKVAAIKVCYAATETEARATVHRLWRNEQLPGQLAQELPLPLHFAQASQLISEEAAAATVPCGPDPEQHAAAIEAYRRAGVDELYVNQIGSDQQGFLDFFHRELRSRLGDVELTALR